MRFVVQQALSQGARSYQQDMLGWHERADGAGLLCVQCDGMGGMEDGEVFAQVGRDAMIAAFTDTQQCPATLSVQQTLARCLLAAQKATVALQRNDEERGGSTVTAVLLRGDRCGWISLGDSRVFLARKGIIQLTRDQNMGVQLDERAAFGMIGWELASASMIRRNITGYLGALDPIPASAPVEPFLLLPGDRIIQLSDGAYSSLTEDELQAILVSGETNLADTIIRKVLEKNKSRQDNCSAQVILVETANTQTTEEKGL